MLCNIVSLEHIMPAENEHNIWTPHTLHKHCSTTPQSAEPQPAGTLLCTVWKVDLFIQNKRWGMLSSGIVHLHDNARPQIAAATKRPRKCFQWEVFENKVLTKIFVAKEDALYSSLRIIWNLKLRQLRWQDLQHVWKYPVMLAEFSGKT